MDGRGGSLVEDQECELEGFGQTDLLELIVVVERATEASIG
jgi:hypothetical protein